MEKRTKNILVNPSISLNQSPLTNSTQNTPSSLTSTPATNNSLTPPTPPSTSAQKELLKEILLFATHLNLILDKDSSLLLSTKTNWKEILKELASEGNFVINSNLLEKKIKRTKLTSVIKEVEVSRTSFNAQAKNRAPSFRVMEEYDVSGQSNSSGKVEDFLKLFRSKYELLSGMLKKRHSLNPILLKDLNQISDNQKVDVIGMVNKKWITKKGHFAIEIEDLDKKCLALVMEKDKELFDKAQKIIEDNVIGIKGVKWKNDFLIVKEFFWPDMPSGAPKTINEEVYVGGISDLHVGSSLFYEEQFHKFLDYINGKNLSPKQQEKVGKIQYLFITGDNVAGIGVYPNQLDDLLIKDVYGQYEKLEELLLRIPEYIQVFICPGQHDAVRRAEPQPSISKEFVPRLSKLRNFHFISSPSWVEIEGLKNLVYHGPSVHDLISSVSFLSMTKPEEAMVELLKKRDLMPKYGGKNPYVPERKDYMVIKEEPDFIWFGDLHHKGYTTYKKTTIINSGCWEGQTDFQKKMGHVPTVCLFPMVNLKTRQITEARFLRETTEQTVENKVQE